MLRLPIQTSPRLAIASAALVATLALPFAAPVSAQSLELDTVEFFSPAVDRAMKYNIVLPRGYDDSTQRLVGISSKPIASRILRNSARTLSSGWK